MNSLYHLEVLKLRTIYSQMVHNRDFKKPRKIAKTKKRKWAEALPVILWFCLAIFSMTLGCIA